MIQYLDRKMQSNSHITIPLSIDVDSGNVEGSLQDLIHYTGAHLDNQVASKNLTKTLIKGYATTKYIHHIQLYIHNKNLFVNYRSNLSKLSGPTLSHTNTVNMCKLIVPTHQKSIFDRKCLQYAEQP